MFHVVSILIRLILRTSTECHLLFQDYVDACERLGHLGLNDVQKREIGRVLVNCCGNVRLHLASKLSQID